MKRVDSVQRAQNRAPSVCSQPPGELALERHELNRALVSVRVDANVLAAIPAQAHPDCVSVLGTRKVKAKALEALPSLKQKEINRERHGQKLRRGG
jgi:hypothetical protein